MTHKAATVGMSDALVLERAEPLRSAGCVSCEAAHTHPAIGSAPLAPKAAPLIACPECPM